MKKNQCIYTGDCDFKTEDIHGKNKGEMQVKTRGKGMIIVLSDHGIN